MPAAMSVGSRHRQSRDQARTTDASRTGLAMAALPIRERAVDLVARAVRRRWYAWPQGRHCRAGPEISDRLLAVSGTGPRARGRYRKELGKQIELAATAVRRPATGKIDGSTRPSSSLVAAAARAPGLREYRSWLGDAGSPPDTSRCA